jgi:DNA invertase Pin-like site-specific DNA recombinase
MLKDAQKGKFDIVMAWAIDRVGRSLSDLLDTIQHLEACGVDLYLDQQNIDTTTPMGKLIFQITGAFAEFERSMIRQRINLGLERARKHGTKSEAPIGRAPIDPKLADRAREALAKGLSYRAAAEAAGVSLGTVQRIAATLRPFGGEAEPVVEPAAA